MRDEKSNNGISDEAGLFWEYQNTKDKNLRNLLAEKHLYIAEIMAKKFVNKGVDFDDLYQIASLALLKAVDRFDPSKGVKFTTYATPSVIGEIKNYFRDKVRLINPGRKNNNLLQSIKNAVNKLTNEYKRVPSAEEIANAIGADIDTVLEALEYNNAVLSLDNTLEDNETSLYEVIPDTENVFEKIDNREALNYAFSKLSDDEKELIQKRFVRNLSQQEIARQMNVSQMFISRLERKIINKMKNMFEIT